MEFEIGETNIHLEPGQGVPATLPVLESKNLSYADFLHEFMLKNVPCIIKNIANKWEATAKWVIDGKPNLDYLSKKYNQSKIIVYNCSERYFNSQKCHESTFEEYQELWQTNSCLYYLKDWHLKLQSDNDNFYEVPVYFASDWLNEYFIHCTKDDYRFVYIGQKDTWTPLHADVFNSYSWSVNVCGRKRWVFFPPGELTDDLNNIPYDLKEIPSSKTHFETIQNPGEAVFVPSRWYHQVWNLEDTISINHNWVNGCNIATMWESLKHNLVIIKKEIDDCKDMDNFEEHCQTMLKALFGMDYAQFFDFLKFIVQARLDMLHNEAKRTLFHGHVIGVNHIKFDLYQIQRVLEDLLNCDDVSIDEQSLLSRIIQTLENIYI